MQELELPSESARITLTEIVEVVEFLRKKQYQILKKIKELSQTKIPKISKFFKTATRITFMRITTLNVILCLNILIFHCTIIFPSAFSTSDSFIIFFAPRKNINALIAIKQ